MKEYFDDYGNICYDNNYDIQPVHKLKNIRKIFNEMRLYLPHENKDACYQISVNSKTGTLFGKLHFRGETTFFDKNVALVGFFKNPLSTTEIESAAFDVICTIECKRTGELMRESMHASRK